MAQKNIVPFPKPQEKEDVQTARPPSQKKPLSYLLGYWVGLFSLAALLILLSWFSTQQRRNDAVLNEATRQHADFSASAMQNMLLLQQENEQLRQQVQSDARTIDSLLKELEELTKQ